MCSCARSWLRKAPRLMARKTAFPGPAAQRNDAVHGRLRPPPPMRPIRLKRFVESNPVLVVVEARVREALGSWIDSAV
jgi:hypothetical protein